MEAVESILSDSDIVGALSTSIDLVIDRSPGTMGRVVAFLRPCGLKFTRHILSDCEDPDRLQLKIIAEGEASAQDLSAMLVAIQGVIQVVDVQVELGPAAFGDLLAH